VKQSALRLLAAYVERATDRALLRASFLPPLFEAVLADFGATVPSSRDASVFSLMSTIVTKLEDEAAGDVPSILGHLFEPTLAMITADFTNFPEIRLEFYRLLRTINEHCFGAFFAIPPESFGFIVDAIVYGFRHTDRAIAETALSTLLELLHNVSRSPQIAAAFYERFFLQLLQEVLAVLTDTMHKSGFKLQAAILLSLIHSVESGEITTPLAPPPQQAPGQPNALFLREHIARLLATSFDQLTANQVTNVVNGLFALDSDMPAFKNHLRDFMVQLKEFVATENEELYLEEKESMQEEQQRAAALRSLAVPGLVATKLLADADADVANQDDDDD